MKINKYSLSKDGTTIGAFKSSTPSSSTTVVDSRFLWGNDDEGGDIDSTLFVNGSLYLKVPDYSDEEDGDNDGEIEDKFISDSNDEGGNIYADGKIKSKEVEAGSIYGKAIYIDYPKGGDKKENVADLIKANSENIDQNKKDIAENVFNILANKMEIDTLKNRVGTNETNITNLSTTVNNNTASISVNTANILNNKDDIEDLKKKVDNNTSAVNDLMPIGSIIMFNGEANLIPEGWAICDGTNGTPNLIGKFIKASTVAGNTGGSDTILLGIENMPTHSHTIANTSVNSSNSSKLIPAYDELYENAYDLGGSSHYTVESGYNNKGDKGLVGIKVGDILGSVTLELGGGQPLNWSPSYYTLVFIMKIK